MSNEQNVDQAYAAITWMPRETTEVGAYWLSNLLESDGLADSGEALQNLNRDETAAGMGCFLHHSKGSVEWHLECVGALTSVDAGSDTLPIALHAECSYAMQADLRWGCAMKRVTISMEAFLQFVDRRIFCQTDRCCADA